MNNNSLRIPAARRLWPVALLLLVGSVFSARLLADEPPPPAQRLAEIQKEIADGEAAVSAAYYALPRPKDESAADKLAEEFMAKQTAAFAVALKMAQAEPDSDVARDALS